MQNIHQHVTNRRVTPQNEKVLGVAGQARNNAGGISFEIPKWDYLDRFLVLGTEGGTYYVEEKKLTKDAAKNVQKCIDEDGVRAVDVIVDISTKGRAANNDFAIYALAMCASCDSKRVRKHALSNLGAVCRISTHLFHFMEYIKTMRGFGRGLREGLANWYVSKSSSELAYQMLKYQQRDGWSHRDVIRLCHPTAKNKAQNAMFAYAVGKRDSVPSVSKYASGFSAIKGVTPERAADTILEFGLTREVVPTEYLSRRDVWEAMLVNMPITALVRNLGKMASLDMHLPFTNSLSRTICHLRDKIAIAKSRIHPIALLNAMAVYKEGHGIKGGLSWNANMEVMNALEYAFYESFENVEPTGKRIMLALDISGSMTNKLNSSLLSCRQASAVLAMVTMRSEPETFVAGFTGDGSSAMHRGNNSKISMLGVSTNDSLHSVVRSISNLRFGNTDCALPMIYCEEKGIDVDAIVIYTDNETWAGNIHPWQALDSYQNKVGHAVKLVVVGMTATEFSIARPDYGNMLDVVGMDTNTPAAISNFIR